jgi:hypothetical protein
VQDDFATLAQRRTPIDRKVGRQINYLNSTGESSLKYLNTCRITLPRPRVYLFLLGYGFFYRGGPGMAPDRNVAEFHALPRNEP